VPALLRGKPSQSPGRPSSLSPVLFFFLVVISTNKEKKRPHEFQARYT